MSEAVKPKLSTAKAEAETQALLKLTNLEDESVSGLPPLSRNTSLGRDASVVEATEAVVC